MGTTRRLLAVALSVCLLTAADSARAALIDHGNGLIYDTVLDLTWLQDANYARTTGYDADGLMTWDVAMTWAASLTYGGATHWRLPSALNADGADPVQFGATSELSRLYSYGIDCYRYNDPTDRSGPFDNLPAHYGYYDAVSYWTSTTEAGNPADAWAYAFEGPGYWANYQGANSKELLAYAWSVHDGAVVPEPGTGLLVMGGLLGFAARRRGCA